MTSHESPMLPPEVRDPRLFFEKQKKHLADVQEHWADFDRREFSWASKGLLVIAILQILAVCSYDVVLKEVPCDTLGTSCTPDDKERLNYITVCLTIVEVFQAYLCVWGVIYESLPMLVLANLNAALVVFRMYLDNRNVTNEVLQITPITVSGVLSGLTILMSLLAGSKFGRLVHYTLTNNDEIITLYRRYQIVEALLVIDTECSYLTLATSFQFEDELGTWDTVIAVALCVVVLALNASLLYNVRHENRTGMCVFMFLSAGFLVYAVYSSSREISPKGSDFTASEALANLSLVTTFVSKMATFVALVIVSVKYHGKGLKEMLLKERTTKEFIRNEKLFLDEGEEPPGSEPSFAGQPKTNP